MITVHRLVQDESFDESFHEHYAYGQSYAYGKFSKRQEENDEKHLSPSEICGYYSKSQGIKNGFDVLS